MIILVVVLGGFGRGSRFGRREIPPVYKVEYVGGFVLSESIDQESSDRERVTSM